MKKYFLPFLLLICCTSLLTAQSQLNVNLKGGSTDSFMLKDISRITIVNSIVSVESVSIEEEKIELKNGETFQVEYTITPENATNKSVSWSSSDNNVATIDGNGLITAVSEGSAVITVETEDGELRDMLDVVVSPLTSVETYSDKISVYPNPIQNYLSIDMGDITKFEVIISDMSGAVLYSQFDENRIDLRQFPAGNYFLTLVVNNKYHNYKIIKN
jgi:transglutaminase/protease-like cytokinesis protein 3